MITFCSKDVTWEFLEPSRGAGSIKFVVTKNILFNFNHITEIFIHSTFDKSIVLKKGSIARIVDK